MTMGLVSDHHHSLVDSKKAVWMATERSTLLTVESVQLYPFILRLRSYASETQGAFFSRLTRPGGGGKRGEGERGWV